jgi:multiple sugar transport system ATP-binding protein
MANVRLDGVRKVYPEGPMHVAVHGATFEVADGELVVLVGPSGSGKSTLLRMVAGLESITEGQLYIGERLMTNVPVQDRDIAMVFQSYALYPHMTVFDNLAFGLKLRKTARSEVAQRVHAAAALLGIEDILERRPRQLSGGQRQRVAVGRAIVRDPQVFLFDEPLSNLDAKLRVQMRGEIASLHQRLGATMIYVTHDQVEAMTLGERIVVLNEGRVQQIAAPLELYNQPANRFVAGFIGSPAMNFITGRLTRSDGLRLVLPATDATLALPAGYEAALAGHVDGDVVLGCRPESLFAAHGRPPAAPLAELALTVAVVEPLGNEIFVYAHAGPTRITARVAPQPLPGPGERIALALDLRRLHFFDAETGDALVTAAASAHA